MSYASYDENGNPIDPRYENPYLPQQAPPPSVIGSAPTAPPIYPGQAGTPYTDFNGQPQTTPQTAPVNAGAPELKQLYASVGNDPQRFVQALIQRSGLHGKQADATALNTILRSLQAVGVNASLDTRSDSLHKGLMLNGQFVKLLDGNDNWIYQPGGGSGSGGVDASAVAPFTEPFTTSAQLVNFNKAPAFDYQNWEPPTGDSILKDPSFQFRLDEGRKALEGSKAAKGTLRTGGTLRDVLSLGQNLASTEYGNIFDRSLASYNTNRNNAVQKYQTNYNSQYLDPFTNDSATQKTQYDREWQQFLDRKNSFYTNQQNAFDRPLAVANAGLSAATA